MSACLSCRMALQRHMNGVEDVDSVPIFAMTANAFGDDIERTKRWG